MNNYPIFFICNFIVLFSYISNNFMYNFYKKAKKFFQF